MGQRFSLGSLSISHIETSYGTDLLEMLILVPFCIFIIVLSESAIT